MITLGVALWAALKGAAKVIKAIIAVLTNVFIFFGLYIPLFYLLFGVILLTFTSFSFGGIGTNQILYFVGLGLCFLASAIITFRTLVVRPLSAIIEPIVTLIRDFRERRAARRAEKEDYEDERYPDDYDGEYDSDYDRDRYAPRATNGYAARGSYRGSARYENRPTYEDPSSYEDGRDDYRHDYSRDRYYPQGDYERDARSVTEPYVDPYADVSRDVDPRYAEPSRDYHDSYRTASLSGRGYSPRSYEDDHRDARPSNAYPVAAQPRFGPNPPRKSESERPLIYYSQRRPGILVMEYSDRFELYREGVEGKVHVGTEYKDE